MAKNFISMKTVSRELIGNMTKGKPWSTKDERKLAEMLKEGKQVSQIAAYFDKTEDSIKKKMKRLRLEVVVCQIQRTTTSNDEDLPSVQDVLLKLSKALEDLETFGLDRSETLRLRSIIQGVKTYKELYADFVNYRALEQKVEELIRDFERDKKGG